MQDATSVNPGEAVSQKKEPVAVEQSDGGPASVNSQVRRPSRMPHERDESADAGSGEPPSADDPSRDVIRQGHEDVERGIVDSERRGIPNDVPNQEHNDAP